MLPRDRHAAICDIIKENNIILIHEISSLFNVSLETARRDLEALQDRGIVKRIHGGAILSSATDTAGEDTPHAASSYEEKRAIGRKAATMVNNGETILLDTGSTTLELARNLKNLKELTVITHSINIINELIGTHIKIIVLGGDVQNDEQFIYSHVTEQMLRQYFVDKAFFSCGGITFSDGITDYGVVLDRNNIAHHADETILLADSGKFGKNARFKACEISLLDKVVVDAHLNPAYLKKLRDSGVEVIVAEVADTHADTE